MSDHHTHHPDKSYFSFEKQEVVIEIKDTGNGFNIKNYQEPTIKEIIVEKKKGGLGLMIVNITEKI